MFSSTWENLVSVRCKILCPILSIVILSLQLVVLVLFSFPKHKFPLFGKVKNAFTFSFQRMSNRLKSIVQITVTNKGPVRRLKKETWIFSVKRAEGDKKIKTEEVRAPAQSFFFSSFRKLGCRFWLSFSHISFSTGFLSGCNVDCHPVTRLGSFS